MIYLMLPMKSWVLTEAVYQHGAVFGHEYLTVMHQRLKTMLSRSSLAHPFYLPIYSPPFPQDMLYSEGHARV